MLTDKSALRALYGEPGELPRRAIAGALEPQSIRFIELSPLVIVASADAAGNLDLSPRGDAPGFVRVVDASTLVIPDRRGNRKLHTLNNVLENDRIGLMFMIPGIVEVLRLRGRARLSTDPTECARHAVQGKAPQSVMIVDVETVIPHCGKALRRAKFFDADSARSYKEDGVPTLAEIALALAEMDRPVDEVDRAIREDYEKGLY